MMDPRVVLDALHDRKILRSVGVPDSTLSPFVDAMGSDQRFQTCTATSECEAMSLALGHYLGSGRPSLIYMQNSGFGKTIHPITSLMGKEICRVPALLMIGWRGDTEIEKDEPQHRFMGQIMTSLLEAIQVPFEILSPDVSTLNAQLDRAFAWMEKESTPFALIVKPGYFTKLKAKPSAGTAVFQRHHVIRALYSACPEGSLLVSTTGKISRELYELHNKEKKALIPFYTVGAMGCASSIALGLSQAQPDKRVFVLDGDGAALMQLESMVQIGRQRPDNLVHILIDNECHDSTGGQPTLATTFSFSDMARISAYPQIHFAKDDPSFRAALQRTLAAGELTLIHVKCKPGDTHPLGRPEEPPWENSKQVLKDLRLR